MEKIDSKLLKFIGKKFHEFFTTPKINSNLLKYIEDIKMNVNLSEKELKKANRNIQNKLSFYLTEFIPVTNCGNSYSMNAAQIKARMTIKYPEAKTIPDEIIEKVLGNMKKVEAYDEVKEKYYYIPEGRNNSIVIRSRNP